MSSSSLFRLCRINTILANFGVYSLTYCLNWLSEASLYLASLSAARSSWLNDSIAWFSMCEEMFSFVWASRIRFSFAPESNWGSSLPKLLFRYRSMAWSFYYSRLYLCSNNVLSTTFWMLISLRTGRTISAFSVTYGIWETFEDWDVLMLMCGKRRLP